MKKKLIVLLTMILSISLIGCSNDPKLNDTNVRAGKAIINAVDAYLDGTADLRTTFNTVETESQTVDEDDENDDALTFRINVTGLRVELNPTGGNNDVSKIIDYRDDIADILGMSKYSGITGASDSKEEEDEPETETSSSELDDIINAPSEDGSFAGFTFRYPEGWRTKTSDDGKYFYIYPTENSTDGMVMLSYEEADSGIAETNMEIMASNILASDQVVNEKSNVSITINGWTGREILYTQAINGDNYDIDGCLIPNGDAGIMYVALTTPEGIENDFGSGFQQIIATIEYAGQ